MNLSMIAFAAMAGFAILFVAAMFVMERKGTSVEFPKSDVADDSDENPFEATE